MPTRPRPLSPHLSVYRFTLTMTMSIVHRITGIGLYGGMALLALWLFCAAIGGGAFATIQAVFGHWFGQVVLIGFTWALFHHFLGGLRYFAWDATLLMGSPARHNLALLNLVGSIVLTLLVWTVLVWFR
jgi:succinate dehydrogenase / fumarate reductase cytochrome b subunit